MTKTTVSTAKFIKVLQGHSEKTEKSPSKTGRGPKVSLYHLFGTPAYSLLYFLPVTGKSRRGLLTQLSTCNSKVIFQASATRIRLPLSRIRCAFRQMCTLFLNVFLCCEFNYLIVYEGFLKMSRRIFF